MTKKQPYTVIFTYPESMADFYAETFTTYVRADTPLEAVRAGRIDGMKHLAEQGSELEPHEKFGLLALMSGHVEFIPETEEMHT